MDIEKYRTDDEQEDDDCEDSDDWSTPIYTWCLHCEKVFRTDKWRDASENYSPDFEKSGECPECGAGECIDGWAWSRVAEDNNYPMIPEEGKYYPLYG